MYFDNLFLLSDETERIERNMDRDIFYPDYFERICSVKLIVIYLSVISYSRVKGVGCNWIACKNFVVFLPNQWQVYFPSKGRTKFYTNHEERKETRPGDLVMPDPFGWLFGQNLDYLRPYKNQVESGYKGHPIEFMVDFL